MAAPHAQYYPPPPQNPYYGHTAPQYVQPQPPMQYPAPRPMYMQPHSSNVTNNINVGGGNQVQYLSYVYNFNFAQYLIFLSLLSLEY